MTTPHNDALKGIGMTSQRTRDRLISRLQEEGISHQKVLTLIREIPRHIFVDEALASRAYEDNALPIGHSQTISQPYIVALMTQTLLGERQELNKVLEIGTGSGYQTAILAKIAKEVFSIERIAPLLDKARQRFYLLNMRNIRVKYDSDVLAWQEFAPFDGIMVTAAAPETPHELLTLLAEGGRLVVPVGPQGQTQYLYLFERTPEGCSRTSLGAVQFVPLLQETE